MPVASHRSAVGARDARRHVAKNDPRRTLAADPWPTVNHTTSFLDIANPLGWIARITFTHENWNVIRAEMLKRSKQPSTGMIGNPRSMLEQFIIEQRCTSILVVYHMPVHARLARKEAIDEHMLEAGVHLEMLPTTDSFIHGMP